MKILDMHLIFTVIAVFILAIGIFVSRREEHKAEIGQQKEVLSEETQNNGENISVSMDNTNYSVTQTPTPVSTLKPTVSQGSSIMYYRYPNSSVANSSATNLSLQSQDSEEVITDWYKSKILEEGMSIKTFVTTRANDKVLNKLTGVKVGREIYVEISKERDNSTVYIMVEIK